MRYPAGTAYQGPHANYDAQVDPEQFLARVVYGRPAPLLMPGKHRNDAFYGRLFSELANAHACFVAAYLHESSAHSMAHRLRQELDRGLYSVGVVMDPDGQDWMVVAYNRVTRRLGHAPWANPEIAHTSGRRMEQWLPSSEVARVLGVTRSYAAQLMLGVEHRRTGGRNEIQIRRRDLVALANRKGRWQRRTRKAA